MAKTLISSSTLFLSVAEFLNRCDQRTVQQLASDTNTPIASGALATNEKVLAALKDSCGMFESAMYAGDRYQNEDLELIVATDCHARNLVYRIVADMAVMLLMERRPDLRKEPTEGMKRSAAFMQEMYEGKKILPFQETAESGHADHEVDDSADVESRGMISYTAERLFGRRNNRLTD